MATTSGSRAVCSTLESLELGPVFCLPGTEIVELLDGLRGSRVGTVVTTNELAATFMALGYARASGRAGLIAAIPGPGLAYTLAGLAEARYDSVPLIVLTGTADPAAPFDVGEGARVFAKDVIDPASPDELVSAVRRAHDLAVSGEPGPVVLRLSPPLLRAAVAAPKQSGPVVPAIDEGMVREAADRLASADRVLLFAGQGAAHAAPELQRLVERIGAVVLTTTSGRGAIPETHRLSLAFDSPGHGADELNDLIAAADVVLMLGCGLNPNGTLGGELEFDPERLIRVDTSEASLERGPAGLRILGDAPAFATGVLALLPAPDREGWKDDEVSRWRKRLTGAAAGGGRTEPSVRGAQGDTAAAFFAALRRALPDEGTLVLDSGLHQQIARRHFTVLHPRSLLVPADFQSMGYAVPAAIGAKLADPSRAVVALLGDGGLAISGLELLTAAREGLALTVVVFNDGYLNLIRLQQLLRFGRTHGVEAASMNLRALAETVGATYVEVTGDAEEALAASIAADELRLVEVIVQDTPWMRRLGAVGTLRRTIRRGSSMLGS
jgi:acetolactate synthase I/II/III large subunit